MNTILISGTAQTLPVKISRITTGFKVMYKVNIYGSVNNSPIQYITEKEVLLCGYGDLWTIAKNCAKDYFNEDKFLDGAYTQYLDHLITQ